MRIRKWELAIGAVVAAALLSSCGLASPPPLTSSAPRPIVISSTSTPGPNNAAPASSGPADANPTALTPFATSTQAAPTAAAQQTLASGNQVRIVDFSFTPPALDVSIGTQITWTNAGPSNHTVTANDGSFDSGTIQRNAKFTFTPTKAGTFVYHCSIHPTMQATLIVR